MPFHKSELPSSQPEQQANSLKDVDFKIEADEAADYERIEGSNLELSQGASLNAEEIQGSNLETAGKNELSVTLVQGSRIGIGPNSRFTFDSVDGSPIEIGDNCQGRVEVARGSLFKVASDSHLEIDRAMGCMVELASGATCHIEKNTGTQVIDAAESSGQQAVEQPEPVQASVEPEDAAQALSLKEQKSELTEQENNCPDCGRVVIHKAWNFCPYCGYERGTQVSEKDNEPSVPLDELSQQAEERSQDENDNLHSCPDCGRLIKKTLAICPYCAHQFAAPDPFTQQPAQAVQELSQAVDEPQFDKQPAEEEPDVETHKTPEAGIAQAESLEELYDLLLEVEIVPSTAGDMTGEKAIEIIRDVAMQIDAKVSSIHEWNSQCEAVARDLDRIPRMFGLRRKVRELLNKELAGARPEKIDAVEERRVREARESAAARCLSLEELDHFISELGEIPSTAGAKSAWQVLDSLREVSDRIRSQVTSRRMWQDNQEDIDNLLTYLPRAYGIRKQARRLLELEIFDRAHQQAKKAIEKREIANLEDLQQLTPDMAQNLVKSKLRFMNLSAVRRVSEEVVKILVKSRADIDLSGLATITEQQAKMFVKHKGHLFLTGLEYASEQVIDALAKRKQWVTVEGDIRKRIIDRKKELGLI